MLRQFDKLITITMGEEAEKKKTSQAHIPKLSDDVDVKPSHIQEFIKNLFFDFVILFANSK